MAAGAHTGGEGRTLAAALPSASASAPATEPVAGVRWQAELAQAYTSVDALWAALDLPGEGLAAARQAAQGFAVRVPRGFVQQMRRGDPSDPLLRQVLPQGAELAMVDGFSADPLAETGCQAAPGLLTKYQGRALLVLTGACAVHCRYCFRRHFPYDGLPKGPSFWQPAIAELHRQSHLHEIILSGGDPLTLSDTLLAKVAADLAGVPHLRRIRVHTRLPVVLPSRVTDELLAWLTGTRLSPVMVIHANHANEFGPAQAVAIARLRAAGVLVLNQAVLLAGINDSIEALVDLHERLGDLGVAPYYLHALDRVQGAAHFAVSDDRARELHGALHARLSGWLVPRLVRELPGQPGKSPL